MQARSKGVGSNGERKPLTFNSDYFLKALLLVGLFAGMGCVAAYQPSLSDGEHARRQLTVREWHQIHLDQGASKPCLLPSAPERQMNPKFAFCSVHPMHSRSHIHCI